MRIVLLLIALAGVAHANPRPLPFTYTTETRPEGTLELEQVVDLMPARAVDTSSGAHVSYLASQLQTELEYGLTDRLELGLYVTIAPSPGDRYTQTAPMPDGTGAKQRLRYTLAAPGEWPIDVGVYGELVENEHEVELEGKLLLQRRFGDLRVAANLTGEYELYFVDQRDVVLAPSVGATYEVSPHVALGLDAWMRSEDPSPAPSVRSYGLGPVVYAGPAVLMRWDKLWWSVGAYGRVDPIDHALQPGEPYGRAWVRSMVGYDL
jgi:hypothetical protein